ncbi:MAG: T9SS type A sorting domain-containing protein [Flavobacteriaceae bacterium]|nr:T9SS type A sorting domain-containing protein [Flavobacteriaceae bacterium]
MPRALFILFLSISLPCLSQIQVLTSNVKTNALVYSSTTDRIYATVPSSNGISGNSIGTINPYTSTLQQTVPIGTDPTVLAISDDEQYLYNGFAASPVVRRYIIGSSMAGLQIQLGNDATNGDYIANDIEVLPGQNNSVVVSRKFLSASPSFAGLAVFDDNTQRTTTSSNSNIANVIEFTNTNSVLGFNNETSEYGLRDFTIDANGISQVALYPDVLSGDGLDFIINGDFLYASDGTIVDVSSTPSVLGQFADANGPAAYDANFNLVVYASNDGSGNLTLKRYDADTYDFVDDIDITQASGDVKTITVCGEGCYSFNTTDKVVIVRNLLLGVTEFYDDSMIGIFPNPSKDYIAIKTEMDIVALDIYNMGGKLVKSSQNVNQRLNIQDLSEGLYVVVLKDSRNNSFAEKLIKN